MNKKKLIVICFFIVIVAAMILTIYISNSQLHMMKSSQLIKPAADITETYTIKFELNGGTGGPANITTSGGDITIPADVPTKTGYYLWCWKIKDTDVTGKPGETFYSIENYADSDGIVTFVAQWGFKIVFDSNGGTGGPNIEYIIPTGGYTYTVPSEKPTKDGYDFIRWVNERHTIAAQPGESVEISDYDESRWNNKICCTMGVYKCNGNI